MWRSSILLLLAACQQQTYSLDDRPCDSAGQCVAGYVCDSARNLCVRPGQMSATGTQSGTATHGPERYFVTSGGNGSSLTIGLPTAPLEKGK